MHEDLIKRLTQIQKTGKKVFIAKGSVIIGDVTLGDDVSIWYNAVLRGDVEKIIIGAKTNIQDGSVVHVTNNKFPVKIGKNVTIGHGVMLHGCTICDNVLIGIGAIILDGAIINKNCIVAAGTLVPPGKEIPSMSMVMGNPAKIVRTLEDKDLEWVKNNASHYVEYKNIYLENNID